MIPPAKEKVFLALDQGWIPILGPRVCDVRPAIQAYGYVVHPPPDLLRENDDHEIVTSSLSPYSTELTKMCAKLTAVDTHTKAHTLAIRTNDDQLTKLYGPFRLPSAIPNYHLGVPMYGDE